MSINPWCHNFKNHENPQHLTLFLVMDHAHFDICCNRHQFKQTKRAFSLLPALQTKLSTVFQPQFEVHAAEIICNKKGGRSLQLA